VCAHDELAVTRCVPLASQFVVLVAHKMKNDGALDESKKKLEQAFRIFDTNKSGHIDNYELRRMMVNLGEPVKLHEVDELIQHFDEDGDGTIDIDEVSLAPRPLVLSRRILLRSHPPSPTLRIAIMTLRMPPHVPSAFLF
jgi:hypothetical protein